MLKKWTIPLLLTFLLATLGYTLSSKNRAPEVRFTTIEGGAVDMSQLRGKMVLVNFWATTCPGCIAEMPKLIETYQQHHAQGFELIAVAMSYDPADQVKSYATQHKLPFHVALDAQGTLAQRFGDVRLTPTTILVDKQGNIVRTVIGELDFTALNRQLDLELGRAG